MLIFWIKDSHVPAIGSSLAHSCSLLLAYGLARLWSCSLLLTHGLAVSGTLEDRLRERTPALSLLSLCVPLSLCIPHFLCVTLPLSSPSSPRRPPVRSAVEETQPHRLEGAFWFARGDASPRLLIGRERAGALAAMRGCAGTASLYPGELARLWPEGESRASGGSPHGGARHHAEHRRCRITIQTLSAERRFAIGFPLVLSHATERELQLLQGIGASRAAAIISARSSAPLLTPESLLAVHGIGPKTLARVLSRLQLSAPRALWSPDAKVDEMSD